MSQIYVIIVLTIALFLMFGHWIADFCCQNDYMADNKGHDGYALFLHSIIYSYVMTLFVMLLSVAGIINSSILLANYMFFSTMLVSHVVIDHISSRLNDNCIKDKKIRKFFTIIGLDQWIHYFVIFMSFSLIFKVL